MAKQKTKLEPTWIGKENRPNLEPRILIEDPVVWENSNNPAVLKAAALDREGRN